MVLVQEVFNAINGIVKGRFLRPGEDPLTSKNPYSVVKSSGIPGKEVREHPGLVHGNLTNPVSKVAVALTLTESHIELCGATGVDLIVVHHPVADAASSGGIPLRKYLGFYDLSLIELHEAFHGIHPGRVAFYGLNSVGYRTSFMSTPGVTVFLAESSSPACTLGDFVNRIKSLTGLEVFKKMSESDRLASGWPLEDMVDNLPAILAGDINNPVKNILEIFPQGGFTPAHLEYAVKEYKEIDTVFQPCAPLPPNHKLVIKARELGLNYVIGAHHGMETYENCLPLAQAIKKRLPSLEVVLLQHRVSSVPVEVAGTEEMLSYGENIVKDYLS